MDRNKFRRQLVEDAFKKPTQKEGTKMLVDLKTPLLGLDKEPVKDEKGSEVLLGKSVANIITSQASDQDSAIKLYHWGIKLFSGEPIEIDQADADMLLTRVKKAGIVLLVAQVEEIIKKAKEVK